MTGLHEWNKVSRSVGVSVAATLASTVIIAAALGYWAGFRSGVERGSSSHAVEARAVSVGVISLLDAGNADKARSLLEASVDDGLLGWDALTSTRSRLSEQIFGSSLPPVDDERFIRRLAGYRKGHKSPWAIPSGLDTIRSLDPTSDSNWQALKERDAKIASVVERYAP